MAKLHLVLGRCFVATGLVGLSCPVESAPDRTSTGKTTAGAVTAGTANEHSKPLERIAFGSCAKQDQPQPVWDAIVETKPPLFLFLGDNIYGDTEDMTLLKQKWDLLAAKPGFQTLKQTCQILGTWDDHDFGADDGGAEYPKKRESQQIFLDFLGVPQDSPRR